MNHYNYSGYFNEIKVEGELAEEGILTGRFGNLHFMRCKDGLSIIDSHFLGNGFIDWPTSIEIGLPGFINGIPVTETHQMISIDSTYPIAVEGSQLKRAFLTVRRKTINDRIEEEDAFRALFRLMLRNEKGVNQNDKFLNLSVDFYRPGNEIDYCELRCNEKVVLGGINARCFKVIANFVVLKGHAYRALEEAEFTGKVYPFIEDVWGDDRVYNDYFADNARLKKVEGSLRGDNGWIFENCKALEKVHLANGIRKVPRNAFKNCSSVADLYIPDTVAEIGEYAFAGCSNLRTIHLPAGIRKISKGMFMECKSLTKCFLADGIEVIEDDAFKGCSTMKKPWIPKNIKTISKTAFDNPEWGNM